MTQFKEYFRTEGKPFFICFNVVAGENGFGAMNMSVLRPTIASEWKEVIDEIRAMPLAYDPQPNALPFSMMKVATRVAQTSRRGVAKTFFCNDKTHQKIKDSFGAFGSFDPEYAANHTLLGGNFIEIADLDKDLVLACYHKVTTKEGGSVVDGPFAVYEDQLYTNPNWQDYFCKAYV